MEALQNTEMRRGAIWASAIPVGIGAVGLVFLFWLVMPNALDGEFHGEFILIFFPIIACFLFGAPLSVWLACRSLMKINSVEKRAQWRSFAGRLICAASGVHLVSAFFYTVGAVIINEKAISSALYIGDDISSLAMIVVSAVMNVGIWIIITLPLSLISATIFWKVTKFPEDASVF